VPSTFAESDDIDKSVVFLSLIDEVAAVIHTERKFKNRHPCLM
jgi:hypothetical protein